MKAGQDINNEGSFSLTETILWEACCGFWLLPEHLERLRISAEYFSREYNEGHLREQLESMVKGLRPHPHKVRVMLGADGEITMTAEPEPEDRRPVRAALARHCVDTNDPFLYHKTTNRKVYETALADMPGYDEVILWNEKGEVTESCTGNIVVEQAGQYYTPPVSCGLLPGTYRSRLLQENRLVEWSIPATQLTDYTKIYVINSVVGWREVEFISY